MLENVMFCLLGILEASVFFYCDFFGLKYCKQRKGKSNKVCKKLCGNAFECEYHYFNKNKAG